MSSTLGLEAPAWEGDAPPDIGVRRLPGCNYQLWQLLCIIYITVQFMKGRIPPLETHHPLQIFSLHSTSVQNILRRVYKLHISCGNDFGELCKQTTGLMIGYHNIRYKVISQANNINLPILKKYVHCTTLVYDFHIYKVITSNLCKCYVVAHEYNDT